MPWFGSRSPTQPRTLPDDEVDDPSTLASGSGSDPSPSSRPVATRSRSSPMLRPGPGQGAQQFPPLRTAPEPMTTANDNDGSPSTAMMGMGTSVPTHASLRSSQPHVASPGAAAPSTQRRNRAHTVSVSFKPQSSPSSSRRRTSLVPIADNMDESNTAGSSGSPTTRAGTALQPTEEGRWGSLSSRRRAGSAVGGGSTDRRISLGSTRSREEGDPRDKDQTGGLERRRRSGSIARSITESMRERLVEDREGTGSPVSFEMQNDNEELHDDVVGVLDVIDPHVSTVNHLQNMSNTLIFPHFPALWSRRPQVILPDEEEETQPLTHPEDGTAPAISRPRADSQTRRRRSSTVSRLFPPQTAYTSNFEPIPEGPSSPLPAPSPTYPLPPVDSAAAFPPSTIPSSKTFLSPSKPSPTSPTSPGSSSHTEAYDRQIDREIRDIEEEVEKDHQLDAHVKKVLISRKRKDQLKRMGRGLWAFLKTPMGAITAIYGFLVAFWGAAIVLFLLGWIPTSSKYRQDVWVEISSQVENGLFTLTGIGLIPWRVIDTYRIAKVWHLRVETHKRRKARGLPPIEDPNDLPDPKEAKDYVSVLTEKEQEELEYQQHKFAQSQTWYRPHATATHRAFPIKWALWNTLLMDGNSFFQAFLCGTMWGINWHKRPAWTTGLLIPASFLCGIGAGVLIWQGSARTKKTVTVQDKLREALNLPIAIAGIQRTGDGTIIVSNGNEAPLPESKLPDPKDSPTKGDLRKAKSRGDKGIPGASAERGSTSGKSHWWKRGKRRKSPLGDEEKGLNGTGADSGRTTMTMGMTPLSTAQNQSRIPQASNPALATRRGQLATDPTLSSPDKDREVRDDAIPRRATITFGQTHRPDLDLDIGLAPPLPPANATPGSGPGSVQSLGGGGDASHDSNGSDSGEGPTSRVHSRTASQPGRPRGVTVAAPRVTSPPGSGAGSEDDLEPAR